MPCLAPLTGVAGTGDLLLINSIWPQIWDAASEIRLWKACGFHLGLSLSPPHSEGSSCHVVSCPVERTRWQRSEEGSWATASKELSPWACEGLNPAKPPRGPESGSSPSWDFGWDAAQPDIRTVTSWESLSQRYPAKPHLVSYPKGLWHHKSLLFQAVTFGDNLLDSVEN